MLKGNACPSYLHVRDNRWPIATLPFGVYFILAPITDQIPLAAPHARRDRGWPPFDASSSCRCPKSAFEAENTCSRNFFPQRAVSDASLGHASLLIVATSHGKTRRAPSASALEELPGGLRMGWLCPRITLHDDVGRKCETERDGEMEIDNKSKTLQLGASRSWPGGTVSGTRQFWWILADKYLFLMSSRRDESHACNIVPTDKAQFNTVAQISIPVRASAGTSRPTCSLSKVLNMNASWKLHGRDSIP